MKGIVLAILIVGGALSLTHRARVELKQRQREKDAELEYVQLIEKDIERLSLKLEPSTKILNLVNVNTATGDELDAIPYVSPYHAKGIIANRPYDAVEDLDRVASFNHPSTTLFVFSNVEVVPGKESNLSQSKPSVRGAFVHCLSRASSVSRAEADVRKALKNDNYIVIRFTDPIAVSEADVCESVFAGEWKQRDIKHVGPEVYYSDFFCFNK